ncbi:hypothetical protein IAT40_001232 [Kwoniella sp. CBS 6097]
MEPFNPTFDTTIIPVPEFRLAYLTGPFFLGFILESFGMGVVLILSINYFLSLASRPKSQHESSRRLGVSLAAISLVASFGQTVVDLVRGWDMFAVNFMNLPGFLTTTPLYFTSPFLGLIPSTLTQLFLLRRITLFLSSLDVLWPRLAHPGVKGVFVAVMGCVVLLVFVSGTMSSVLIAMSGNMHALDVAGASMFSVVEQIWLGGSTAVDLVLSLVLCIELWWARQKLGIKGGVTREIVTRLILVTCHGGLAVSGLQLSSLLLYNYWRHNSFCYLPIIFLPKVYNITLLLSLSVPHSTDVAPSPSHVFSLPTILDHQIPPAVHPHRAQTALEAPRSHENGQDQDQASMYYYNGAVEQQNQQDMRERSGNRPNWISRLHKGLTRNVKSMDSRHNSTSHLDHRHSGILYGCERCSYVHPSQRLTGFSPTSEDRRPSDPKSISPLLRHEASYSPGIRLTTGSSAGRICPSSSLLFSPNMNGAGDSSSASGRVVWIKPGTDPTLSGDTGTCKTLPLFQQPDPFGTVGISSISSSTGSPILPNTGTRHPREPYVSAPKAGVTASLNTPTVKKGQKPILSAWHSRKKAAGHDFNRSTRGRNEPGTESSQSQTRTMSSTYHMSQTGTGFNSLDIDGLTFDDETENGDENGDGDGDGNGEDLNMKTGQEHDVVVLEEGGDDSGFEGEKVYVNAG